MKWLNIIFHFRVWLTTESNINFPIGLLQMSLKFTNEPPQGIRASLKRTYADVTQDTLDYSNHPSWPSLLYSVAFLHTVVQVRYIFKGLKPIYYSRIRAKIWSLNSKSHIIIFTGTPQIRIFRMERSLRIQPSRLHSIHPVHHEPFRWPRSKTRNILEHSLLYAWRGNMLIMAHTVLKET